MFHLMRVSGGKSIRSTLAPFETKTAVRSTKLTETSISSEMHTPSALATSCSCELEFS